MENQQSDEPDECRVGPQKELTQFERDIEIITVTEFLIQEWEETPSDLAKED